MKTELKIFENEAFGKVRVIERNNEPWFVGKDVAEILGYVRPAEAIRKHVDTEDTLKQRTLTNGGEQELLVINESGLYSLILSSKLPAAKQFKRWVTSDVLPAIRKTGSYGSEMKAKEVEAKLNNSKARLNNSRARMAALILKCAENTKSDNYKEICNKNAVDILAGREIMPMLGGMADTLSAEEVGAQCGISGSMVGRIANKYGLKTGKYGQWYHTTCKYNKKREVDTFRYFPSVVPEIQRLLASSGGTVQ